MTIRIIDRTCDRELTAITSIHVDGDEIHGATAISSHGDEKYFDDLEVVECSLNGRDSHANATAGKKYVLTWEEYLRLLARRREET